MQAYFRSGAYEDSLKDSLEALNLDSTSTKALFRAALAFLILDQPSKAIPHLISAEAAGISDAKEILHQHALDYSKHQLLLQALQNGHESEGDDPWVLKLRDVLEEVWADAEGDADANIPKCLKALAEALNSSARARTWFEKENGYRLVWFYFVPAHGLLEPSFICCIRRRPRRMCVESCHGVDYMGC